MHDDLDKDLALLASDRARLRTEVRQLVLLACLGVSVAAYGVQSFSDAAWDRSDILAAAPQVEHGDRPVSPEEQARIWESDYEPDPIPQPRQVHGRPHAIPHRTQSSGPGATVVYDWSATKTGGPWVGLPTPTASDTCCVQTAVAGVLAACPEGGTCAATKLAGSPTVGKSAFFSGGLSGASDPLAQHDGAVTNFSFPSFSGGTTDLLICADIWPDQNPGAIKSIFKAVDSGYVGLQADLFQFYDTYFLRVNSDDTTPQDISSGSVGYRPTTGCWSYHFSAGVSTMRYALNGVAAHVTGSVGPLHQGTHAWIGGRSDDGEIFGGGWSRLTVWTNYSSPDDATIARATKAQWTPEPTIGGALTVTRAASESIFPDGDGKLHWCPAGVLCAGPAGGQTYNAYAEALTHSEDIVSGPGTTTSPWNYYHVGPTASLSVVSAVDPTGAVSNVSRVDFPAETPGVAAAYLYQVFTGTAAAWTESTFIQATGADCTVQMDYYLGSTGAGTTHALHATSSWQRLYATETLTAATWLVTLGPDLINATGQPTTQDACSVLLYGANATATSVLMPYVKATAAPVSQPATTFSFVNPLSGTTSPFCIGVRGTWARDIYYGSPLSSGSFTGANSWKLVTGGSGGGPDFEPVDAAGTVSRSSRLTSLTFGVENEITGCFKDSGVLQINGVKQPAGLTVTTLTQPASIYTAGPNLQDGTFKAIKMTKGVSFSKATP